MNWNQLTSNPNSNFEKKLQEIKFLQNKYSDKQLTAKVLSSTTLWQLAIDIEATYINKIWLTSAWHETLNVLRVALQKEYYNNKHFSQFQFFTELLNPEKDLDSIWRATTHLQRNNRPYFKANAWLVDTTNILRERPIGPYMRSTEHKVFDPTWK